MNVLLTGAYGRVGTALIRHLGDDDRYDWTYLDVEDHPEHETVVADVRDYDAIRPAFEDQDAVIHLALSGAGGEFDPANPWGESFREELEALCNVYGAAIDAGVERFVYASSAQVISKRAGEWAIARYHPDEYETVDERIGVDDPVRPDSLYGVIKAFGEDFGRFCHEAFDLRVYCIRIGWLLAGAEERAVDHPYATAERGVDEGRWERDSHEYHVNTADPKWLSHRDAAQLFDRCLRDETVGFDLFHGISDNVGRWLSIERAREVLGYDPQDDVAEWDGPPEST